MQLKCLIVDDETLAQDVIEKYISNTPTLSLAGKCDNAVDALAFLHDNKVDLLFLDLNMPELSGLDMLKTLNNPPKVILTTAYSEYALESYEYGVVDYLLKPIRFERFLKAVNKVVEQIRERQVISQDANIAEEDYFFIKEEHINYSIKYNDLIYVEAYGNYLKLYTKERTYVIRETMQSILERLPAIQFIRIHKSFIVSLSHIKQLEGNRIFIRNEELPIGDIYKASVKERIEKK